MKYCRLQMENIRYLYFLHNRIINYAIFCIFRNYTLKWCIDIYTITLLFHYLIVIRIFPCVYNVLIVWLIILIKLSRQNVGKRASSIIAIQEIIKEYQRQKTNQRSRKGGSARKPQQYHAEAEVII